MHLDSAPALFAAIGIILPLIKLRVHVGYAIVAGATFLALATHPCGRRYALLSRRQQPGQR